MYFVPFIIALAVLCAVLILFPLVLKEIATFEFVAGLACQAAQADLEKCPDASHALRKYQSLTEYVRERQYPEEWQRHCIFAGVHRAVRGWLHAHPPNDDRETKEMREDRERLARACNYKGQAPKHIFWPV